MNGKKDIQALVSSGYPARRVFSVFIQKAAQKTKEGCSGCVLL